MSQIWQASGNGFAFEAGGLSGAASAANGRLAVRTGVVSLATLGPLSWHGAGDDHQAPAMVESLYPQHPALVAAFAEMPAGLRLTAFLHAEDRGFGMDLRLTPTEELHHVRLPLALQWQGQREDCAALLAGLRRPGLGKGVSVSRLGRSALLLDVGEHGLATFHAGSVECRLFDSFLEKGVIAVARWAVRPWTDEAALRADLVAWLDAPPAL